MAVGYGHRLMHELMHGRGLRLHALASLPCRLTWGNAGAHAFMRHSCMCPLCSDAAALRWNSRGQKPAIDAGVEPVQSTSVYLSACMYHLELLWEAAHSLCVCWTKAACACAQVWARGAANARRDQPRILTGRGSDHALGNRTRS